AIVEYERTPARLSRNWAEEHRIFAGRASDPLASKPLLESVDSDAKYLRQKAWQFRQIAESLNTQNAWQLREMADNFERRADKVKSRQAMQIAEAHSFLEWLERWRPDIIRSLQGIIGQATSGIGAPMGNIQVLEPVERSLRIAASVGFGQEFLDYFAVVQDHTACCGAVLKRAERVIVEDVYASPIFHGTPAMTVMRKAGCMSVQSTPLIFNRRLVGVLSTHRRPPSTPS